MTNLKEQIKKIYDFVNIEFDIEDKEVIEGIKQGLELEKIERLDNMLQEYNKQLQRLKRKEQQRLAQKKYKNIQTNLKIEKFEEYAQMAEIDNISISEMTKRALEAYIAPKTASVEELEVKKELEALKAKYEALNADNKQIREVKNTLETKNKEFEENKSLIKSKNERLTKAWETSQENLIEAKAKIEEFKNMNWFQKLSYKF